MEIIRNSGGVDDGNHRVLKESSFRGYTQAAAASKRGVPVKTGDADAAPKRMTPQEPNVVTNIKPALRDTHRVNVFIDGKFSFSLDLAQLADYKLKIGQELTAQELEMLISASNFGKLYARTLEYAFSRPHSVKEVRDHLKKKQRTRQLQARRYEEFQEILKSDPDFRAKINQERQFLRQNSRQIRAKKRDQAPAYTIDEDGGYTFRDNTGPSYAANNEDEYGAKRSNRNPTKPAAPISDQDIEEVIKRLVERGYVSDENFARYYVENRNTKKGISTKRLRLELRQKGVADYLIDQALTESPRDQSAEIQKIIDKKRRRGYDDQKLIQYLLRQGFDYELVRSLVLSETD